MLKYFHVSLLRLEGGRSSVECKAGSSEISNLIVVDIDNSIIFCRDTKEEARELPSIPTLYQTAYACESRQIRNVLRQTCTRR